jgi:hypothetical protein
VKQQLKNSPLG